ncbi:D-alanyl-D-alanine carboxypeptidase/D-alanyl-D-alanine-endopeptidase [Ignavibacteriales bacterium]
MPVGTYWSVLVVDAETNDTVYTYGHRNAMIPASNTKVVTSAAALHLLGGDFVLSTELRYSGRIESNGTLSGNLYLKALGNPLFTTKELEGFVARLKKAGVREISGDVTGDDSYFDDLYSRSQYVGNGEYDYETYPLSALVLDKNIWIAGNRFTTPPVAIAEKLKALLEKEGIKVAGKAKSGVMPVGTVLVAKAETKLAELLKIVNKRSDNFFAEYTMKLISAAVNGERGNTKNGIKLCIGFLIESGAFLQGTTLSDGSGLSRRNMIPTGVIVKIYEFIYVNQVFRSQFFSTLSISGVDGTLRSRMEQANGDNNLKGKTGTLSGVITLSGYFKTRKGRDMIGAVFFNYSYGYPNYYRSLQDQIFNLLIDKL